MESQELFNKYNPGRHWEKHPTIYAEIFSNFLKSKNFSGTIVDAGCGNGRDVNLFSSLNFNVIGIDYSKDEIKIAKKNFPSLSFQFGNVESTDFENNGISAIFCINVIHYVRN